MEAILHDVNEEQRTAITHGEGPLLVVAGAGSGKTRVITRRIAWLVGQGVAPAGICALTFTNKASREMRERVEALVPARDLWVCTFHGFAARVLRRFGDRVGFSGEFTIVDTEDRTRLLKEILKELHFDDLRVGEVAVALTRLKNGLDRPGAPGFRAERVTRAMTLYQERLRALNAMDFDDLLLNLVRLLEEDGEARRRLQARASHLLVDEYQDTNSVQYRILTLLCGSERNLCATGDPDQSIYRWRGATIRNILDFERDFPGARVVTLDRNYRSTKAILAVANAVIRHNRGRREKELRTENAVGTAVREIRCLDESDEASAAAATVGRWLAAGRSAREIALFYRVNAQSRAIERALTAAGVPYRIVGAVEFFRRKEVKDLMAYARLSRNPSDEIAFRRILNVPPRGLGERTEGRLVELARARGIAARALLADRSALAGLGRARRALGQLADLLDRIAQLPPEDPGVFLETVADLTGYRLFLADDPERLANVEELINAAAEYALREPTGGVDGFLQESALTSDGDGYDASAETVTLMTTHSAKGLEFPCVLVTGLMEEVFPHALSLAEPEEVEEERRLFYVAVTRAREELALLHAASRLRYGAPTPALPSRFLDEIPGELLEVEERGRDLSVHESGEAEFQVGEGAPSFVVGDRVRHDHFGSGRVAAVATRGGTVRITVEFDGAGRRELALEFARLTRG
ncbi:MAG: ATP-dependent helicase [Planctomycetaceae bacterium]